MAQANQYQQDFQFLATLHADSISELELERDMTSTLDEIHRYMDVSKTLDLDWTHHLLSTTCAGLTGGELALLTNRLLRTASVTKEKLQNLMQRFTLFDSVYLNLVNLGRIKRTTRERWHQGRGKHDVNAIDLIPAVVKQLTKLDNNISEMEYELRTAEKIIGDEKRRGIVTPINPFEEKVQKMEEKLEQLAVKVEATNKEPQLSKRKLSLSEDGRCYKVQVLSDDEYLSQLIHENSGAEQDVSSEETQACHQERKTPQDRDQKEERPDSNRQDSHQERPRSSRQEYERPHSSRVDNERPQSSRKESEKTHSNRQESSSESRTGYALQVPKLFKTNNSRRDDSHVAEIQRDLWDLQRGLQMLPKRKYNDCPALVHQRLICAFCRESALHFSDSCPEIRSGEERLAFVERNNLCRFCLLRCDGVNCKYRYKKCWYCEIVEVTILRFLIPVDEGHHRALCSIPDSKERIQERINEVSRELEAAKRLH